MFTKIFCLEELSRKERKRRENLLFIEKIKVKVQERSW